MEQDQLKAYFKRIGYEGRHEPTLETLRKVQWAQVHTIPFETFDISMGVPIVLTQEAIFDKLVTRKRGGYCYEVNALIHFALQAMGFKTYLALARLTDQDEKILPASVHMVVIVELEKTWLVDVGWGNGFAEPFLVEGTNFCHQGRKLYEFSLEKKPLDFFDERNHYHQTAYPSVFVNEPKCSLLTAEGCTWIGQSPFESDAEYRSVLKNVFGLDLKINRPLKIESETFVLHSPRNQTDWNHYHRIRIEQIHTRYCLELVYNDHDQQENENHPLVFRRKDSNTILGVMRIDFLPDNEASFRWIAIDGNHQRNGLGTEMLRLAESYLRTRKIDRIRIPATSQSLIFARHMGFSEAPWALMPKEDCMIGVVKELQPSLSCKK